MKMASCSTLEVFDQSPPTHPAAMPTSHRAPEDLSPLEAKDWMSDFIERIAEVPHPELTGLLDFVLAQNSSPCGRRRLFRARRNVSYLVSQLNQADWETGDDGEHTEPMAVISGPNDSTEQAVSRVKLLSQPFDEFLSDALSQIEGLDGPNDAEELTFRNMSDLTDGTGAIESNHGHKLIDKLNRVGQSQQKVSLHYAMTATEFTRWFESKIQHFTPLTRKDDEANLRSTLLQKFPGRRLAERRQALTRCLMQGRKWNKLVQKFGYGILFMKPMQLAVLTNGDVNKLIELLPNSSEKMFVIGLLNAQFDHLRMEGRLNVKGFLNELHRKFPDLDLID
ncbi:hypothetical protein EDB81DRAFT_128423 [Dactylonectria macrodidyma]|uniref:Uncharacterized protein n=1 Tax=Dactylonectria macrodidyma TaxID=307937 RepID=A0A9P9E7V6_9HYPO|nr:hypothetical protein EDB81DRAFT_128423 [Dactylonectria macrodidyma]